MHDVVRTVFARLYDLDPAIEEPKLQSNEEDSELKVSVGTTVNVPLVSEDASTESETLVEPSVDQRTVPSPATLERTECTPLTQLKWPTC